MARLAEEEKPNSIREPLDYDYGTRGTSENPARVGKETNPGKLANFIKTVMKKNDGSVFARSQGKAATYEAIKAAFYAETRFAESELEAKRVVVFTEMKQETLEGDDAFKGNATTSNYWSINYKLAPFVVAESGSEVAKVTKETNVGKLAGYIKAKVIESGEITLSSAGINSVAQALKSTALAQKYMREDGKPDLKLGILPAMVMDDKLAIMQFKVREV